LGLLEKSITDQETAQLGLASLSLTGTENGQLNVTATEKSKVSY